MADEKMNDKEDEQCDQQSQASTETTSSSDPVAVEENPVNEAPHTDQKLVRNRRASCPTDEEVELEGKRPRYSGSSSDSNLPEPNSPPHPEILTVHSLTDLLIKQLIPVIESWLHAYIRNLPPGTTLSIPGVASPPRPPRTPTRPRHPGSKPIASSDQRQRLQQAPPPGDDLPSHNGIVNRLIKLEAEVKILKAKLHKLSDVTEYLVIKVEDYQSRLQYLEAEVNKLKGRSELKDLKANVNVIEGVLIEAKNCQRHVKKLVTVVKKLKGSIDDMQADSKLEVDEVINLQGGNVDGLQADLVDYKLTAKVKMSSEGEIANDDKSCSSGGRVKPIPSVDAELQQDEMKDDI